jgi:hypothetical protein
MMAMRVFLQGVKFQGAGFQAVGFQAHALSIYGAKSSTSEQIWVGHQGRIASVTTMSSLWGKSTDMKPVKVS